MELLTADFGIELLLATERQRVVFNRELDLLLFHVWQLSLQHQLVLAVAIDVDHRHPRAAVEVFLRPAVEALEHPAHPFLQRGHVTGRIPTNDSHDDSPFVITLCRRDCPAPRNGTRTPTRQPRRLQAVARAPILWKVELDTSYV